MLQKPTLAYASGASSVPLIGATIGDHFERMVALHGDREALVDCAEHRRWTYSELDIEIDEVARGLMEMGVARGDRLAFSAPFCAEWILVQYAAAKIGAVFVELDPAYGAQELTAALAHTGVSVLFTPPRGGVKSREESSERLRAESAGLREVVTVGSDSWQALLDRGGRADHALLGRRMASLSFDDAAAIRHAAGTRRAITLSHHGILNNGYSVAEVLGIGTADRVCLPVTSGDSFGLVGNVAATSHGACIVIPALAHDAGAVLRAVADERVTVLYGDPQTLAALLGLPGFASYDLRPLRAAVMPAASGDGDLAERMRSVFSVEDVLLCSGPAEAPAVTVMTRRDVEAPGRIAGVGPVMPHLEAQIVDPGTGRTVRRAHRGELCIRGYAVMPGSWADGARAGDALDDAGWLHTGVLAAMDADGCIDVLGPVSGGNAAPAAVPAEVEELAGHA